MNAASTIFQAKHEYTDYDSAANSGNRALMHVQEIVHVEICKHI